MPSICYRFYPELPVVYRSRRDLLLTAYSVLYFFTCTYIVCLANSYADHVNTNNFLPFAKKYTAPDLLLDTMLPVFETHKWIPRNIPDIMVLSVAAATVAFCFTREHLSLTVLRRTLVVTGSMYLLRAPMVALTVLPTPWKTCVVSFEENIIYDGFLLLLQQRTACGDVFFSGHSILFTTGMLIFWFHCKTRAVNIAITVYSLLGMLTLMLAGLHYTIDVVMAAILNITMWLIYYWTVLIPQLGTTRWGSVILWWDDVNGEGLNSDIGIRRADSVVFNDIDIGLLDNGYLEVGNGTEMEMEFTGPKLESYGDGYGRVGGGGSRGGRKGSWTTLDGQNSSYTTDGAVEVGLTTFRKDGYFGGSPRMARGTGRESLDDVVIDLDPRRETEAEWI